MNENQDLLDLCRLNAMEENIAESPAPDKDNAMAAIDWKKRNLLIKIKRDQPSASQDVLDNHVEQNQMEALDEQ